MVTAKLVKELRDLTGAGMMDCKKALEASEGDIQKAVDWLREKGVASAQKKAGRIAAEGASSIVTEGNKAVLVELNSETDFVAKNETFVALVNDVAKAILNNNVSSVEEALALDLKGQHIEDAIVSATATIGEKITLRRFEVLEKNDDQVFGSYIHMGGKISAVTVLDGSDESLARDIAMQVASMAPVYISRDDIPQDVVTKEEAIQIEILKNDPSLASKPEKVLQGIVSGRVAKTFQEVTLLDQVFFKDQSLKVAQLLKNAHSNVTAFARFVVGEGLEKREEDFAAEVLKATQV